MESDDLDWERPIKRRTKKEHTVEKAFVKWCRENGITQMKLQDLGSSGYPDRTVFLGSGRTACIEFKKPKGKDQPRQVFVHQSLTTLGIPVLKTSCIKEAISWVLSLSPERGILTNISPPQKNSSSSGQ